MYGLLGKSLKHSLSKDIHTLLGNPQYQLIETDDLASFFANNTIQGLNVTIPHKENVIPYLSRIDALAMRIGSVNTIVVKDEQLIGYNTDYVGLKRMISHYQIEIEKKKILILGNGAVSKTCQVLFEDMNAAVITKICRHPKVETEIPFKSIDTVLDYDIIVNTTPVGMYPNNDELPIVSLEKFSHLSCVVDLIYNPIKTQLMLAAIEKNIPTYNGLYMLVMQAAAAHELFFNHKISDDFAIKIYHKMKQQMSNIVMVGLPLSGKSKYSVLLSSLYKKELIDTDESIEQKTQKKISEIFESEGESAFRLMESDFVDSIYKSLNIAISTGGGMIENHQLMLKLKQNGVIIFLDKNPERIAALKIQNRPLIKNSSDVLVLAKRRIPLYEKYADITIKIEKDTAFHLSEIEEKLNEYFSS